MNTQYFSILYSIKWRLLKNSFFRFNVKGIIQNRNNFVYTNLYHNHYCYFRIHRLQNSKNTPELLRLAENQRAIVTLTEYQIAMASRLHPDLFKNNSSLPRMPGMSGSSNVGGHGSLTDASGARVCPPNRIWDPLNLAISSDGSVVQLIQVGTRHAREP